MSSSSREEFAVLCRQHTAVASSGSTSTGQATATSAQLDRLDPVYLKWTKLGGAHGPLGLPIQKEQPAQDGCGRTGAFQYGSIWWSPNTGAHALTGPILETWLVRGGETGPFGYPLSDVTVCQGGNQYCEFENGVLYCGPSDRLARVLQPSVLPTGPITAVDLLVELQAIIERILRTVSLPKTAKGTIVNAAEFRNPSQPVNPATRRYEIQSRVELVMPAGTPNVESVLNLEFEVAPGQRAENELLVMIRVAACQAQLDSSREWEARFDQAFAAYPPRLIATAPATTITVKALRDGRLAGFSA